MFITLLFLTGITFSAAALSRRVLNDLTWAVTAGGSAYWGLSFIASRPFGLTIALTVTMIPFLIPISTRVEEWEISGWDSYNPVALAAVAIGGVYLGSYLTPWIVMSPFLELAMEKASQHMSEGTPVIHGIYNIVTYALSLCLNPILILYITSISLVRQFKPSPDWFKAISIDSLIRLLLWVISGWIVGL